MEELLKQILGKLESLSQSQLATQKELTEISSQINTLGAGQKTIHQSQVKMEHELSEKLRALFDDREINKDYFESLKDGLARTEEDIEAILTILKKMDTRQTSQEREIRLLRTGKNRST